MNPLTAVPCEPASLGPTVVPLGAEPRGVVSAASHHGWLEVVGRFRSLTELQQNQGHASFVTTQRCARLSDDAVRREAERLARS